MPNFNLAPLDKDNLDPVWPTKPSAAPPARRMTVGEARATYARRSEAAAGPLKPVAQFMNTLASPDTKIGIFTGPLNAISKLGNAVGDLVQGKPVDVKDAWQITPAQARAVNPFRLGIGQEVTPSDEPGLQVGGVVGAEVLGAALTGGVSAAVRGVPAGARLLQSLRSTAAVRRLAVAQRVNPALRAGLGVTKNVGEALASTGAAALFIDADSGNSADAIKQLTGVQLPGTTDPNANYLQRVGTNTLVDGLATPLALIGAGSVIGPLRRALVGDGIRALDEIADVELAPYMPRPLDQPALPPAAAADVVDNGSRALPPYEPSGGALVPYDSAISRSLQEQTQIRQVAEQRQWLQDQGLVRQGEGGQLELNTGNAVDPEAKLMIRDLQVRRGQLVKQLGEQSDLAPDIEKQLAEVDQQITELTISPQNGLQQELDINGVTPEPQPFVDDTPDLRPEIDTYLAHLEELDDQQLRGIHSRVSLESAGERNAAELTAAQEKVQGLQGRLQEIEARAASGEVTPTGAKRMTSRVQKELELAQRDVSAVESRMRQPEALVGDQLQLQMPPQQLGLDLAPSIEDQLGPIRQLMSQRERLQRFADDLTEQLRVAREAKADPEQIKGLVAQQRNMRSTLSQLDSEIQGARGSLSPEAQLELSAVRLRSSDEAAAEFGGYQTPDDYRSALQGWNRDQLRRLAMPQSSPEVAALVQARTGRRVWQAKKSDIIDALVELSERKGQFLPPEPPRFDQGSFRLTTNPAGNDAPLLERPADLSAPGMTRMVDADGNEVLVPASDYLRRGLDPETRQRLKAEILQRAIDNGEVQAPVSPLPIRPQVEAFEQGSLVDQLFSDPSGQLALRFASGELPAYRAGGKGAEALIEEMRLRFEYRVLDAAAQRAQRAAFLEANGWDQMSWEAKKASGLLDFGQYFKRGDELPAPVEQAMSPGGMEPGVSNRSPVEPRRPNPYRGDGAGEVYEWTPDGLKAKGSDTADVPAAAADTATAEPAVKPSDGQTNPVTPDQGATPRTPMTPREQLAYAKKLAARKEREAKAKAAAERRTVEINAKRASDNTERLRKERARIEKQIQEGTCNG
jgi:hypothetical protein